MPVVYDVTFAVADPNPESPSARGPDLILDGFIRAYGSAFVGMIDPVGTGWSRAVGVPYPSVTSNSLGELEPVFRPAGFHAILLETWTLTRPSSVRRASVRQ